MAGLFSRIFGHRRNKSAPPINVIAKKIEKHIEEVTSEIFARYHAMLLEEPVVYVIFGVWGARKDGPLTEVQQEINGLVAPVLKRVRDAMALGHFSEQQYFALDYLVRSLIITKIMFMIDHYKIALNHAPNDDIVRNDSVVIPDTLSAEWLNNLNITDSESWRRRFNNER